MRSDPGADVARLARVASLWLRRYGGSLGNALERDELVAEGWLALERTGSWRRAEGAMRDALRMAARAAVRRAPVSIGATAVAPLQRLVTEPRELAWAMRSQGYLFREIGARIGVTDACAGQWVRQLERERGQIEGVVRIPRRRVRSPVRDRLVPELRTRRITIAAICREFGVSRVAACDALTRAQGDRPWRLSNLRAGSRCARGHDLSETRGVSASGKLYCRGCRRFRRQQYRRRLAERAGSDRQAKGGA